MDYCLVRQDAREEYWAILRIEGIAPETLMTGMPLDAPPGPVHVTLSAWGEWRSDYLEQPVLVVSEAVRQVFEAAGVDNIQYFPVHMAKEHHDEEIDGYWLANVIGKVACVDPDASAFEGGSSSEQGELRGFEVDRTQANGLSLFRLAEDPRVVVISSRVRSALESAHLEGLLLQETRAYTGYAASTALVEREPDHIDRT